MRSETFTDLPETETISRQTEFRISENTAKETTIQCVLRFAEKYRVAALNFANAMYPGGGYVLGGNAQEESLCRATLLYHTIKNQKEYYNNNRLHVLPDYTDAMIYSENVPIIRDDSGKLLENRLKCDFITCPAVNRTLAKHMMSAEKINNTMRTRIERIIRLAVIKQPEVLVLGAFGCGVFGNKREVVYPLFEEAINKYIHDSMKVIFADP